MIDCFFDLNGKPLSDFHCGAASFPAFSGAPRHINQRVSACIQGAGPIPPGAYYLIDRQSGGLLGPLRDLFTGRDQWFALYAIDGNIDDQMFCDQVKRGLFRLHPKGIFGRSEGCIVINEESDFIFLRGILKAEPPNPIPGTSVEAYGRVFVR